MSDVTIPRALFDEVFGDYIRMAAGKRVDPLYGREVAALGKRIGFGALMATAAASWAEIDSVGGEFTIGPCRATATRLRDDLAKALHLADHPTPSTFKETK